MLPERDGRILAELRFAIKTRLVPGFAKKLYPAFYRYPDVC